MCVIFSVRDKHSVLLHNYEFRKSQCKQDRTCLWSQVRLYLRVYRKNASHFETVEHHDKACVQIHGLHHIQPCYMHKLKHRPIFINISLSVAMLWKDRKLLFQTEFIFRPSNCCVNFWRSNGLPFSIKVKMLCAGNDNKCSLVFKSCCMLRSVGALFCSRSVYRHKYDRREVKFQLVFKSAFN
jgi:hypothetical protein